jgi:hypothetical protein
MTDDETIALRTTVIGGDRLAPIIIVRIHPNVRRDLALLRQLHHVNGRRVSPFPARPAFQRRLKFPSTKSREAILPSLTQVGGEDDGKERLCPSLYLARYFTRRAIKS